MCRRLDVGSRTIVRSSSQRSRSRVRQPVVMMTERQAATDGGRVPVVPSEGHAVLCQAAAAAAATDRWDEHHVRLPCSPQSLYPQRQPDGKSKLVQRWSMVQDALLRDIRTSDDLENAIKSYNSRYKDRWDFAGLRYFIDEVLADEERRHLFSVTLPQLCRLALRLPELLPAPLPLLARHRHRSVTLSQLQVAALLANAFFCTFPRRNAAKRGEKPAEYSTYPDINFNRLFAWSGGRRSATAALPPRRVEKLKCLLHYFHRVLRREPTGLITFTRRYLRPAELPDWAAVTAPLPSLRCHSDSLIEDQQGMLQVDFANKFVGGGVLGDGCVQEEIRFLINPELIVTRLFTEVLDATECLVVTGCERFSQFEGYADSFKWTAKATDPSPTDQFGRRSTQIVALDATHFIHASRQYEKHFVLRELNKAFVGFGSEDEGPLPAVATGNWGCGAFNGDPHLKALLQLMAAAVARRELVYLTFGDETLRDQLLDVHAFLQQRAVTVGRLYGALLEYGGLYAGRSGRPDLLRFLRAHLAASGGSDYGSDTDAEPETEREVAGLDQEDWSQNMSEETPEVTSPSKSREDHAMSDMDTGPDSQPPADGQDTGPDSQPPVDGQDAGSDSQPPADRQDAGSESQPPAEQHSPSGVKRARRADSDPDAGMAAELESGAAARTEAGTAPGTGTAAQAEAGTGTGSAAQQFARFEVISETARQRAATRQVKITSYLPK